MTDAPAVLAALRAALKFVNDERGDRECSGLYAKDHYCITSAIDMESRLTAAIAGVEQMAKERDALIDALTASASTKAAYIGEFSFQYETEGEDEDGFPEPVTHDLSVPWDTIKEIMVAIHSHALTKDAAQ